MRNKALYAENWNDEIRPAILKRDEYKCKHCRIKHREYVHIDQNKKRIVITKVEHEELKIEGSNTYRIYLQVAHIDHNKSNNNPSNLISLCNLCHYKNDLQHKRVMRIANVATTPES